MESTMKNRVLLTANLYFDTVSGRLQELIPVTSGVIDEDLGDGTGYATFGCLVGSAGELLDAAVFPSVVSCGDERAHGKIVTSIEGLQALFSS